MLLRIFAFLITEAIASFLRVETGHRSIEIDGRDPYYGHYTRVVFTDQTCIRAVTIHCLVPLTGAEEIDLLYTNCENGQWRVAHYNNKEERFYLKEQIQAKQLSVTSRIPLSIVDLQVEPCSPGTFKQADPLEKHSFHLNNSPYQMTENLTIEKDEFASIEAGVQLFFPPNTGIFVYGTLYINGTDKKPVYLEAIDEKKPWIGMIISSETPSTFSYLNLSGSVYGITVKNSPAFPIFDHVVADSNQNGFTFDVDESIGSDETPIRVYKTSAVNSLQNGFTINGKVEN
ncbi:unnamed protein product, partial [Mesorhabditis belari]|uniref:Uncharacterized protein n=1 Tax=Mesorhabditis belari TaxID=2138241 RepID=A0AAF3F161_9BILA